VLSSTRSTIERPLASAAANKTVFEAGRALSLPDAMERACEMLTNLGRPNRA
jgi:hypothetical protein